MDPRKHAKKKLRQMKKFGKHPATPPDRLSKHKARQQAERLRELEREGR
jgi:hypothetical protein